MYFKYIYIKAQNLNIINAFLASALEVWSEFTYTHTNAKFLIDFVTGNLFINFNL
jgi:hypothetical protein